MNSIIQNHCMNSVMTQSLNYFCHISFKFLYHIYQCGPQECGFFFNLMFYRNLNTAKDER